jgi:hypothetical protein
MIGPEDDSADMFLQTHQDSSDCLEHKLRQVCAGQRQPQKLRQHDQRIGLVYGELVSVHLEAALSTDGQLLWLGIRFGQLFWQGHLDTNQDSCMPDIIA